MRKWHLNSNFTAHNSFYHFQKGLDGTSIQIFPLRRIDGGMRCNERLYKERNPPPPKKKRGDEYSPRKKTERERENDHSVKNITLAS